ncbi:MAG: phosphopantothenoylcysteine decarboxylase [Phycisphaerales bacterium]
MIISAGPTHEPIDAVRFIGNRSSGRMGIELTRAALDAGWRVMLMLGPVCESATLKSIIESHHSSLEVRRFRTCEDLRALLDEHAHRADCVIMAAAVADYRPVANTAMSGGKFRRAEGPIALQLESTPDLIAGIGAHKARGQLLVGFALEPAHDLERSAREKLDRKNLDIVIANPLETMDSDSVNAMILRREAPTKTVSGEMLKRDFAPWVMNIISDAYLAVRRTASMKD